MVVGSQEPTLALASTSFACGGGLNFELTPPKEITIAEEGAEPLLGIGYEEYRPN